MNRIGPALRARFTMNRVLIAIVLGAAVIGVLSLFDSSSSRADHAVALVPPNALLYTHLEVDRSSAQWRNAGQILGKLTLLATLRDRALGGLAAGRTPKQLDDQLRPWLGNEAALALLPRGRRADSLILLKVRDLQRAKSFLAGAGRSQIELYRGLQVRIYKTLAAAFVGQFLAIGKLDNVHAAIAANADKRSLAGDGVFRAAGKGLDLTGPLLYAYAPGDGVRRLLQQQQGLVGRLGDLLARPSLRGVAAAVRFQGNGMRISISNVDYEQLPGAASQAPTFVPALHESVPQDAIAYYAVEGVSRLFRQLQAVSGGRTSELSQTVDRFRRSLGPSGLRALVRALGPLDRREAALVVTPPDDAPVATLVVGNTSRSEGGDVLLALQPLLARLASSTQGGQAATVEPGTVAGIDTVTLRLSTNLALTYAAFGSRLIVSTSPDGVRQFAATQRSLAQNSAFAPGMRDLLRRATSVVFLDLHRLSSLVDQAGLGTTPEFRAIKPDLARIGAVSVITQSERSTQTAQVFVEVP